MASRLTSSTSPYLRQHADNPVDWYEWGPEAFADAAARAVPIMLSVGYAACHWCHVMAHESFENERIADYLNAHYVSIKVDREERPDIDAVYMSVTQALSGQGGWPMTVILTPDGKPMFAGTYFPPEQFMQVLEAITNIWVNERERALATSNAITDAVSAAVTKHSVAQSVVLADAIAPLVAEFDWARGGFGGAPKFPAAMTAIHLLRAHANRGSEEGLAMATSSLEAMARGGIYDQLDGGFARYSVDAGWRVPHFEKMLYDNALLLRAYTAMWRENPNDFWARIVRETADFLLRRMRTAEGGFASSLDADAGGVEGSTYTWSYDELVDIAGVGIPEIFDVTPGFGPAEGRWTLALPGEPPSDDIRAKLMEVREQRVQPGRDDKVITSWNGLAITALAEAGMVFAEPSWLGAAQVGARFIIENHWNAGRLRRLSRDGVVSLAAGMAPDYGNFAASLLMLHQADGDAHWLKHACDILDVAHEIFIEDDAVYDMPADGETLIMRPRSGGDNAEPGGASSLAMAYIEAFALTGETRYRELAEICANAAITHAGTDPRFAGWAYAAAEALEAGPVQVAVVGDDKAAHEMFAQAWRSTSPGLVRVMGTADQSEVPLLAGRTAVSGRSAAYVCRGFVCDVPITDPSEFHLS